MMEQVGQKLMRLNTAEEYGRRYLGTQTAAYSWRVEHHQHAVSESLGMDHLGQK